MRLVSNYVFVICMILIRCHKTVIMILWLLWRMLLMLLIVIVAFIVRSVMMFSLLFSFIIVIASTMIKMGMIMSLLPLHWTAIRWAFVDWIIIRAIHHRLGAERSEARWVVERRWGGLLGVRAVGKGVVAVAQSVTKKNILHNVQTCLICRSRSTKLIFINQAAFTLSWTSDADTARTPSRCAHC